MRDGRDIAGLQSESPLRVKHGSERKVGDHRLCLKNLDRSVTPLSVFVGHQWITTRTYAGIEGPESWQSVAHLLCL
jgi:hypothetical protein